MMIWPAYARSGPGEGGGFLEWNQIPSLSASPIAITAVQGNSRRAAYGLPDFDGKYARIGMASCHIIAISPLNTVGHIERIDAAVAQLSGSVKRCRAPPIATRISDTPLKYVGTLGTQYWDLLLYVYDNMKLISTRRNQIPIHSNDMFCTRVRSSEQFGPCSVMITTRPTSTLIGVPEKQS